MNLSVKLLEISDERKAIKEFGSASSGASLGDILGPVITKNRKE
jgi:small subunit ribosomal protein S1